MIHGHITVSSDCPMRRVLSHLAEEGSEMLSQVLKVPYLVNGEARFELGLLPLKPIAIVLHPPPSPMKTNRKPV